MRYVITVFLLAATTGLLAQKQNTAFTLYSRFVKDSFTIHSAQIIKSPADTYFCSIYTLDGDETFMGAKPAFSSLTGLTKNVLLISIGYGAAYGQKGNRRDRDYSPVKSDTSPGRLFLYRFQIAGLIIRVG